MTSIITTKRLTRTYGGKEVVSNVNMNVKTGEIYGLLGPNGAGKSTIMKMITSLVKPTAGAIELFGEQLTDTSYRLLGRMGTIIEHPIFYDKLTARENLELHCEYMGYHNKKSIDESLELVQLNGIDGKAVCTFSLGMKQRLAIARAITTKPELLIFDEPINGLDPLGIKELRNLFHVLCKQYGITIVISSHILGEIELIADTIAIMNNGRLMKEVSMERITEHTAEFIEITTNDTRKAAFVLENKLQLSNIRISDEGTIRIYDGRLQPSELIKDLVLQGVEITAAHKKKGSLEDYFMSILNGGGVID
ncbi:ATP-binding cassette domain-containing protein [Paenibacillus xylaniclasticus]|uniref:ATP-binding cassette domain-containing protein n=1 Tax=Paenibacillus xylaniclasticus TaxID=588083 RepID=UPI000FD7E0F9|nr:MULTISPECIES: ATP-binding cassette domain-containing protein [Paenibacillus]GFN33471.1 bacitracin ABC transporter ATP-binding protein [Paenibacillus curdlanolyticus]